MSNKNLMFVGFLLSACSLFAHAQKNTPDKSVLNQSNSLLIRSLTNTTIFRKQELIDKNPDEEQINRNFCQSLVLLESALKQQPNDANLNYKVGLCYYFSADQQLKALPYFQKAIKKMKPKYDFNSTSETAAPYNTLYFLAATFLEAGKVDSALVYFSLYKDRAGTASINADREIEMCYNARESDKHQRNVQVKNIATLNTTYSERNPVVKIDNSLLFFSCNKTSDSSSVVSEDIYLSKKNESGGWSKPESFPYNTVYDEAPLFISIDGRTLYFRRTISSNTDIYLTHFLKDTWSKPEPFFELNTAFNENGLSLTADGKTLVFSSDRNKEAGKYDLFIMKQEANGKWGPVQLLPSGINTIFNEVSPFINPDSRTLFFSSDGFEHKGTGGYDIYYSELGKNNTWSVPQSMEFPVNSTRNDVNYYIAAGNKRYYSRLNGNNGYDLYAVEGAGFDFESFSAMDVVKLTEEMDVSQIVEVEKEIEKEVEVVKTVETEVEVIKEVEVVTTVEGNVDDLNMGNLTPEQKAALIEKVKAHLVEELKDKQSVSFKTVYFDINKSNLSLLSINELTVLVEFLNEHPQTKVEVIGNTDNTGNWQTNLQLSTNRAKEVYEFLLKNKVSPDRMYFYGRASAVPLVENTSEENRSKNRRVEVIILQ